MMNHKAFWRNSVVKVALVLALVLLLFSACSTTSEKVLVTRVIDGDTIEIQGGDRVRYIGIDTPERGEPYYLEATAKNEDLVEGRRVRLEKDVSEKDRYGRLLRYIYVDDLFVNAEMVRLGYARAYPYPPDTQCADLFSRLESEAKQAGRGLWAR
jgi:micrococcal nuclease